MNKLKALLGFDPKTTTVKTELIAGMTTFLTMCYILAAGFGGVARRGDHLPCLHLPQYP